MKFGSCAFPCNGNFVTNCLKVWETRDITTCHQHTDLFDVPSQRLLSLSFILYHAYGSLQECGYDYCRNGVIDWNLFSNYKFISHVTFIIRKVLSLSAGGAKTARAQFNPISCIIYEPRLLVSYLFSVCDATKALNHRSTCTSLYILLRYCNFSSCIWVYIHLVFMTGVSSQFVNGIYFRLSYLWI